MYKIIAVSPYNSGNTQKYTVVQIRNTVVPLVSTGEWLQDPPPPQDTKIHGCSRALYKMAQYLHITYPYPRVYFKSSLNYLYYLIQCKCYIHSRKCRVNLCKQLQCVWQIQVLLFGTFWNFFKNIFDPQLVESIDAKPADMKG